MSIKLKGIFATSHRHLWIICVFIPEAIEQSSKTAKSRLCFVLFYHLFICCFWFYSISVNFEAAFVVQAQQRNVVCVQDSALKSGCKSAAWPLPVTFASVSPKAPSISLQGTGLAIEGAVAQCDRLRLVITGWKILGQRSKHNVHCCHAHALLGLSTDRDFSALSVMVLSEHRLPVPPNRGKRTKHKQFTKQMQKISVHATLSLLYECSFGVASSASLLFISYHARTFNVWAWKGKTSLRNVTSPVIWGKLPC